MKYSEITINFEIVRDWPFVCLKTGRLHFDLTPDNGGFKFCALMWDEGSIHEMASDDSEPEILCYGWAAFDGIRHLDFGSEKTDSIAYFNYPDMDTIVEAMQHLKRLENEYCKDFGGSLPEPT